MFFTPELLASRDSGFGLLWLAATLGSRSAFKKLPRRSILTADITQLCDLIAEPLEPLALRLSSNLLVGVARVYKVKQDILMSDVTTCFASLKKIVHEFQSIAMVDVCLQMPQSSVRPSAVTLNGNSNATIAMDFDALVADWDEYLCLGRRLLNVTENDDEDFSPEESRPRKHGGKTKASLLSKTENPRGELHTLTEHHDHLLSASFDLSYHGSTSDAFVNSSSQAADNFFFDDKAFDISDVLDAPYLADELAQELGWGSPYKDKVIDDLAFEAPEIDAHINVDNNDVARTENAIMNKDSSRKDDLHVEKNLESTLFPPPLRSQLELSPAIPYSQSLFTQDDRPGPLLDITFNEQHHPTTDTQRSKKRRRLLLDARTELTDDELKAQSLLRRGMEQKKIEKHLEKILDGKVWGVPDCSCDHRHSKRRKLNEVSHTKILPVAERYIEVVAQESDVVIDPMDDFETVDPNQDSNIRSSEECARNLAKEDMFLKSHLIWET
ncbi:hypothetical protein H0H92_007213 [Tricholoma furcatifolium]|nr:hypothetical protein H0H92_007213 [Tricholoma furcatifolium]